MRHESVDLCFLACSALKIMCRWLQICAAARLSEDKGDGAVLQCLAENEKTASANCARETSRAVRNALSFFAPGAPITRVCDDDVAAHCASAKPIETRRIGEARPSRSAWPPGPLARCMRVDSLVAWRPGLIRGTLSATAHACYVTMHIVHKCPLPS